MARTYRSASATISSFLASTFSICSSSRRSAFTLSRPWPLDRQPRQLLEHVFADHARVPRRPARRDDDAVDLRQLLVGHVDAGEARRAFFLEHPSAQHVAHAVGLLADLLEHEVLEAAALDG